MAELLQAERAGLGQLFQQVAVFSAAQLEPGHDLRPGHHALHFGLDHLPAAWAASGRRWNELQKEGESGRKKINEYTRYATVVLCIGQSWVYLGYLIEQRPGRPRVSRRRRQSAASAGSWSP